MSQAATEHAFEVLPDNPGTDTHGHLRFTGADGEEWLEAFDLPELAANVLRELGHSILMHEDGWLELTDSDLHLLPQFIEFHVRDDEMIGIATTIQCNHPQLLPRGLFEYQYAIHETFDEAATSGFRKWARTDLLVLLDAASTEPQSCMTMSMELPAKDGQPARKRRLLFGPVEHVGQPEPDADAAEGAGEEEFCPCCLFTKSIDAFEPLLHADQLYGLRLFASHDNADGKLQADCRVNGEEWPQGLEALRAYAATWSASTGLEYRKQYVIVQNAPEHATTP